MVQEMLYTESGDAELGVWIKRNEAHRPMLVCDGSSLHFGWLNAQIAKIAANAIQLVYLSNFEPNPRYESVVGGVELFKAERCDAIIAVGGGSAMDVAKCIKAFSTMGGDGSEGSYLRQEIVPNSIPLLAMPTTAGTGSEATRYAVIYYGGEKKSVTSESLVPKSVLLNPDALTTLPLYQRKATMMDALCHAVESYWSVNSTEESRAYSHKALQGIKKHMHGYLNNTYEGNAGMLMAAHLAGKAINIAQTTAGHAMCYKITSLFEIAHGHAAALCVRKLYPWMVSNTGKCTDPRGEGHLVRVLDEIGIALGCDGAVDGATALESLFDGLGLAVPKASAEQLEIMRFSVNPERLKNHPISLDETMIDKLYHMILGEAR